eukprot:TRINITY_DN1664_c0_g1_i1.p1 TRINITY_DN1664_c0_g1~~TRINITY_DN1664_c0_g1_i1.p1  ORF type:complete len:349 (+),score=83.07 TRINITY_DN1664_c0_g1_i1:128-1048(+)
MMNWLGLGGGSTTTTTTITSEKKETKKEKGKDVKAEQDLDKRAGKDSEDKDARAFDEMIKRANVVHQVELDIDYAKDVVVTREEIEGVPDAFLLHNVLTEEECRLYLEEVERLGFTEAPITTGLNSYAMMSDVRDNLRVMWQASDRMLTPIWQRARSFFPTYLGDMKLKWHLKTTNALNERLRFYRYDPEQTFRPHFDGCYRRPSGDEQSHYTFIIYLNDGFDGGETTFFPGNINSLWSKKPVAKERRVNPRTGTALVFRHTGVNSPLHEGSPHHSIGMRKYVLRSDVMYSLTPQENVKEDEPSIL